MDNDFSRREFLSAAVLSGVVPTILVASDATASGKPAILGGKPFAREKSVSWPILQGDEEKLLLDALQFRGWFRGGGGPRMVEHFEQEYAAMNKTKHCIATNSGTSALVASLSAMDIGPGDEVVTSPYTFVATINCVLSHYALPVPCDVDLESFQLDPVKADASCTENTRCLMPVHIGGSPADMDAFLEIASRRKLRLIEDTCQAHLGRWKDKNLGTLGDVGCFSFQVTKNLSCGDGGAVLTNDDILAEKIFQCHNNGRGRRTSGFDFSYGPVRGSNQRMTEFQGAILRAQMKNIEAYAETRQENGLYLNKLLAEIPGVLPAKLYPGATRSAWHLYMFRVDKETFGLDRNKFCEALRAENIPCWGGYSAIDWVDFTKNAYSTQAAGRIYPKKKLDDLAERVGPLPMYKRLCSEAAWFSQNLLLGPKKNMEIIAETIRRIRNNAAEIAKAAPQAQ